TPAPRYTLARLLRKGIYNLSHLGHVSFKSLTSPIFTYHTSTSPETQSLSNDKNTVSHWLTSIIPYITHTSPAGTDLVAPPELRQSAAEQYLLALPLYAPPQIKAPFPRNTYASDASLRTFPSPITSTYSTPPSSLTLAAIGHNTGFVASLSSPRYFANTSHAEVAACLSAILLAKESEESQVFSDYLPLVRWISQRRKPPSAFHTWMANILDRRTAPMSVKHVKAHTSINSVPSNMNRAADHFASNAHNLCLPLFPIPTFHMAPHCFFSASHGFIEGDISQYVQTIPSLRHIREYGVLNNELILPGLYDPTPPPTFPYDRSPYAYSTIIQLYARCAQLDTRASTFSRLENGFSPWCRFGCSEFETPYHIFSACPHFLPIRESYTSSLLSSIRTVIPDSISPDIHQRILDITSSLFYDSSYWPAFLTRYYLGFAPSLYHLPIPLSLVRSLSSIFHSMSIKLAGRIWADVRRKGFVDRFGTTSPRAVNNNLSEVVRLIFRL
ncbi:hypothetical protein H0H93_011302, partial [Arthromyces matolae]